MRSCASTSLHGAPCLLVYNHLIRLRWPVGVDDRRAPGCADRGVKGWWGRVHPPRARGSAEAGTSFALKLPGSGTTISAFGSSSNVCDTGGDDGNEQWNDLRLYRAVGADSGVCAEEHQCRTCAAARRLAHALLENAGCVL